jgi:hypothetical protein
MEFTPEGDRDYGPFLANAPVLANAEPVEGFDEKISEDVEGMLWLGKLTHECTVFGHKIVLRTLTRGERLAVSLYVQEYENTIGLADAMQTAYLALSIETVDGRALTTPLGPESIEERLRRNFNVVREWYDPTLETLWNEYKILTTRALAAFQELEGK